MLDFHLSTLFKTYIIWTGYTNVLKIDLKCPEKYIKAYIFLLSNGLSSNLKKVKYISIYLTNI